MLRKPKRRNLKGSMKMEADNRKLCPIKPRVEPPYPTAASECIRRKDNHQFSKIPQWLWPSKTMSPKFCTQRQAHREARKSQAEARSATTGKQIRTARQSQQLRMSLACSSHSQPTGQSASPHHDLQPLKESHGEIPHPHPCLWMWVMEVQETKAEGVKEEIDVPESHSA